MTTLTLNSASLPLPEGWVSYNSTRLKYQRLAEAAAENFATNFTATFKNMDDIHNKCTEQFIPMLRETAEVARNQYPARTAAGTGTAPPTTTRFIGYGCRNLATQAVS